MADIDGKWVIQVATLAGARRYDLTLTAAGTTVTGTAVGTTAPAPIRDGSVVGDLVRFSLVFTAPVPMTLVFTLTVFGDKLSGSATSGLLPASSVVGTRTA
jgi:hypothetical protein